MPLVKAKRNIQPNHPYRMQFAETNRQRNLDIHLGCYWSNLIINSSRPSP
jgi:hypothetical protein